MEITKINNIDFVVIDDNNKLIDLISLIKSGKLFAYHFRFNDDSLITKLFKELNINKIEFFENSFYFNHKTNIHISIDFHGDYWISTYGLISNKKITTNKSVNACKSQYYVTKIIFEYLIEKLQKKNIYDINSHGYEVIKIMTPAIFHNLTFYIEVFCKAYLSISDNTYPKNHDLSELYKITQKVMIEKKHNDSLFQIIVLEPLYKFIQHIESIPGNFREHFIKYDDNSNDDTVIIFNKDEFIGILSLLELSYDFITDYFYVGNETHYLETNIYQRMIDKADTEEKKLKIKKLYPHLSNNKN